MHDYEEHYYEPTVADEIMMEYQRKMKDALLESVKLDIESIKSENLMLKEENEKLRKGKYEVRRKERELADREKVLERDFYRKKFSELLKPLEENYSGYYAEYSYKKIDKCAQCDDERKVVYTAPNGDTVRQYCSCNKSYKLYEPEHTTMMIIKFWKSNNHEPKVRMDAKYYDNADDDRCRGELKLKNLVDNFSEADASNWYNPLFKSREECQKYCDWLNSKQVD